MISMNLCHLGRTLYREGQPARRYVERKLIQFKSRANFLCSLIELEGLRITQVPSKWNGSDDIVVPVGVWQVNSRIADNNHSSVALVLFLVFPKFRNLDKEKGDEENILYKPNNVFRVPLGFSTRAVSAFFKLERHGARFGCGKTSDGAVRNAIHRHWQRDVEQATVCF